MQNRSFPKFSLAAISITVYSIDGTLITAFDILLQHTLAKSEHLGLLEPFSDGGFFAGRELRRYASRASLRLAPWSRYLHYLPRYGETSMAADRSWTSHDMHQNGYHEGGAFYMLAQLNIQTRHEHRQWYFRTGLASNQLDGIHKFKSFLQESKMSCWASWFCIFTM